MRGLLFFELLILAPLIIVTVVNLFFSEEIHKWWKNL